MYRANMHEAKNKLSQLVEMVLAGEEVIITNAGKPIAKLIAYQEAQEEQQERVLGALKGKIWISPDFDELPPDLEASFYDEQA
jgi:prevent-host-death family protein